MIDSLQYQNAVNLERLEEHIKHEQYLQEENKKNLEEVERMKILIKEKDNIVSEVTNISTYDQMIGFLYQ